MQTFSKLFNTTLYVCGYWTGFKYLINLFNTIQYHISDCISRVWLGHRFIRNPSWDLQAWRPLGFNGIFFEETESSQRVFGARLGFNLVSDPAFEPICNCQPNRNGPFHFWGPDSKSHFLVFDICAAAVITDNRANYETLPKAQQTQGLSSAFQSTLFRSYHKFLHKSWSIIFRISTKHQLQSLNKISAFRQNVNLKILTKPSFTSSTKIELQNLDQTLKPCPQSLNKNLTLRPNFDFQICTKLFSTGFSSSTWATLTTSTRLSCYLHMPGSHQSTLLNSSQLVSESVSYWQAFPMIGLGSDKNIFVQVIDCPSSPFSPLSFKQKTIFKREEKRAIMIQQKKQIVHFQIDWRV